jgi:MFS family permease
MANVAVGANGSVQEEPTYAFKPHERPTLPGGPANPDHPPARRIFYILIGILIGITSGLGNALITVNLNFAQGTLDLYSDEAAWLTAAYYMTYVSANLLLVKYRQQFGLQPFVHWMLAVYAITTLLHLFVHGFWSAVFVRAANGLAASGLTTLTILYLMQGMSAPKRLAGIMMGISIPQLATPIARMVSPRLLDTGDWHMLYMFELGMTLATLAAMLALPLPPSERSKVFERKDFVTIALLAPGLALLIAVLSEGRIVWWTSNPWLGWSLVASTILIAAALIHEHKRDNPLLDTRWLGRRQMVRLFLIAATVRVLLSEQAFGSVGLLNVVGLINDQMVLLNFIIVVASVAGMLTAVLTLNPNNLARPITIAVALIAVAAFMDSNATNLTRPSSFYLSQALVGFASLLFLAQAMGIGIARTLLAGPKNFLSFVVLFGLSQSVGGLAGSAFLGTFQVMREKFHSSELVQQIVLTDPMVAARIRAGTGAVGGVLGDTALRNAEGAALLAAQVAREANILAYNDVFLLVGVLAIFAVIWGLLIRWSIVRRHEPSPLVELMRALQAQAAAQAAAAQAKAAE